MDPELTEIYLYAHIFSQGSQNREYHQALVREWWGRGGVNL